MGSTLAARERSQTRKARAVSGKDVTSSVVVAGTATPGANDSAGAKGEGTGPANGAGDGQSADSGGISGSFEAGGSGAPGFGYALNMVDQAPKLLNKGTMPYPKAAKGDSPAMLQCAFY